MSQIVIPPDAESLIELGLQLRLDQLWDKPVHVGLSVPNPRPSEFVVVIRAGGVMRNKVTDEPTIIVEAWSDRGSRAWQLANLCRGIMHWFTEINGHAVYDVSEFAGPGNLPDPLTGQSRYTATYSVPIRCETVITI